MAKFQKPAVPPPRRVRAGAFHGVLGVPLMADIDAWVRRLNDGGTGPRWTRTALVIAVLTRAARERGTTGEAP